MGKRPLQATTIALAGAHHGFELGAGVWLVFQPELGLAGALGLWSVTLPTAALMALRGGKRWDPLLAAMIGINLGAVVVHYTLWPWTIRAGLPLLEEAEGLPAERVPPYSLLLLAWGIAGASALVAEVRPAHRWYALAGFLGALPLRRHAERHFDWIRAAARRHPAWWNRGAR